MFGWEFPPHISGGLGTACYGITGGLLKQGVEVLFVVPKLFGDEDAAHAEFRLISASDVTIDVQNTLFRETWEKLTYVQVSSHLVPYTSPENFSKYSYDYIRKEKMNATSPFSLRFELTGRYGKDLMKEVARYSLVALSISNEYAYDVIHVHDWPTYPAGIVAKRASGKPLIVHVHATEFDRSGENINRDVYDIELKGMEAADHIITVSDFTKQIIIERYGINGDRISVVHNAVIQHNSLPKKKVVKKSKRKIVTFLGRITFQKGPDYFVESAKKVLKKHPEVHFVMAGTGDMMTGMIKRVAELRMSSRFHFTGFLKGQEVDRMYAMSDVYVMPSVSEPFGIAPLEALQANVPVIISKQSGVSEVLKNAIKVDFWDTDALANAICGLLEYPSLSKTFKKNGLEEVQNMTWERAAVKINNIYKSLYSN